MNGKEQDTRKYAIYSRKSRFTGKGESIENQIEMCKQYIRSNDAGITENKILVFEDEGFSGGNTKRPQFQQMLALVKDNQIKAIVCYRLDRISRNVADFAILYEQLEDMNVGFHSVTERYDTSIPAGRAMLSMCTVFAQMERETIAERIRDNMHELAKSGRWLGGTTPTGYKSTEIVGSVTIDGKVRKAYKLEFINSEAELVKSIYDKFLETNSLTKTDAYLLQNNVLTKNGKNFTRFSIRAILQNPVYMIADNDAWEYFEKTGVDIFAKQDDFNGKHGIMAYNKTIQKSGKANQLRKMEDWIIAVGKHSGLIEGSKWVKVQIMLYQNKAKSYRKPKSNVALLSGILYCGNCGAFMRPKLSQRLNSDGEKIYSYLCETKERSKMHNCQMKNPNGNTLDAAVCEQIKLLSEDSSTFLKGLETAKRELENNRGDYDKKLEDLNKNKQNNEKEIKALITAMGKAEETPAYDYITQQINELHEKNENLKQQITEMERLTTEHELSDIDFDIIKDMLKSFASMFDTMNVEQKRAALRTLIKRIVWDGENVHVYLLGDDEGTIDMEGINMLELEPKRGDSE